MNTFTFIKIKFLITFFNHFNFASIQLYISLYLCQIIYCIESLIKLSLDKIFNNPVTINI